MSFIILIITSILIIQLYKFAFSPKPPFMITIDFKGAYENYSSEKSLSSIAKYTETYDKKIHNTKTYTGKNSYNSKSKKIYNTKTYTDERGYKRFKDSNKLVHRWVMEKKIGRRLCKEERVHHIDGNKINNKKENLRLFASQDEHEMHHINIFKKYGFWYETNSETNIEYAMSKVFRRHARQY